MEASGDKRSINKAGTRHTVINASFARGGTTFLRRTETFRNRQQRTYLLSHLVTPRGTQSLLFLRRRWLRARVGHLRVTASPLAPSSRHKSNGGRFSSGVYGVKRQINIHSRRCTGVVIVAIVASLQCDGLSTRCSESS